MKPAEAVALAQSLVDEIERDMMGEGVDAAELEMLRAERAGLKRLHAQTRRRVAVQQARQVDAEQRADALRQAQEGEALWAEWSGTVRFVVLAAEHAETDQPARRFKEFFYASLDSWSCARRVIGKAEHLAKGANPRFIVTSLPVSAIDGRVLYERVYCARGDMENRIKEQQLDLFADRTSAATMRANQFRLWSCGTGPSRGNCHACIRRRFGVA
jgi:Transposase DDE domain group 1